MGTLVIRYGHRVQTRQLAGPKKHKRPILPNNTATTPRLARQPKEKLTPANLATTSALASSTATGSSAALPRSISPPAARASAATAITPAKLSARVAPSASLPATSQAFSGKSGSAGVIARALTVGHLRRLGRLPKSALNSGGLAQNKQLRKKSFSLLEKPHISPAAPEKHSGVGAFEHTAAASAVGKPALTDVHTRHSATPADRRLVAHGAEQQPATLRIALPPANRRTATASATNRVGATKNKFAGTVTLAFKSPA